MEELYRCAGRRIGRAPTQVRPSFRNRVSAGPRPGSRTPAPATFRPAAPHAPRRVPALAQPGVPHREGEARIRIRAGGFVQRGSGADGGVVEAGGGVAPGTLSYRLGHLPRRSIVPKSLFLPPSTTSKLKEIIGSRPCPT